MAKYLIMSHHSEEMPKPTKTADRMVWEATEAKPEMWSKHEGERGGLFRIIDHEVNELAIAKDSGTHAQIIEALAKVAAAAKYALDKMTC